MDVKPIETDEEYWAVCAALEPILFRDRKSVV